MSVKTISQALTKYNEGYASSRVDSQVFVNFTSEFKSFISEIDKANAKNESEENIKNIINTFLKKGVYSSNDYTINTKDSIDSAIIRNDKLLVMMEAKKPSNKPEMITVDDINRKAFHELILYYLTESRNTDGDKVKRTPHCEIRRLVVTTGYEWFIFDANDIENLCDGYLEKHFFRYKNSQLSYSNNNAKFYDDIKDNLAKSDLSKIDFVHFDVRNIKTAKEKRELYKVFSAPFLLKEAPKLQVKEHTLNDKFYKELLYIMGLQEEKIDNKVQITINHDLDNTFAAQLYKKFKYDKDIEDDEIVKEKTFELIIIWLNRLLFIKLFEGQLVSFNNDSEDYKILDTNKIKSFDNLMDLFFNVLGKKNRADNEFFNKFKAIPYLNSSLFEKQEIESRDVNINELKNENVIVKSNTVFGKKAPDKLPLLQYVINFLNSYTFCSDAANNNANDIIDAAVLGLIFEKINGYKDGSIYTPSVITEYISKETISRAVINKVNEAFSCSCETLEEISLMIDDITGFKEKLTARKQVNEIINSITICDPAVGSGHFLVSALNTLIAIKAQLGVLFYNDSDRRVVDYDITVQNDVLTVTDGQGNDFIYNKSDAESQKLQETLFNEKRIIIEECLFGVDINPKAVYICQLRLWIELLKNAYYKNGIMETLPNIDIKLKTGNSLVYKMNFEVGKIVGRGDYEINQNDLKKYKSYVKEYLKTSDKTIKNGIARAIDKIKMDIRLEQGVQTSLFYKTSFDSDLNDMFQNDLEWAIEFPELLDEKGAFLGFDCIIGNPPYIQLQTMHKQADYLQKMKYETFARTGDIYCLFYELGYKLLKANGILTFITSNKWMKSGYGEKLRSFFIRKTNPLLLIDFANIKIFDSATVDVNILEFSKQKNMYKTVAYLAEPDCLKNLSDFIEHSNNIIRFDYSLSWVILNATEQAIKQKIEKYGVPLKEFGVSINYGIKTGCNEAFIISTEKKDELIDADPKSAEIIRPILRGKDIKRYNYNFADLFLIIAKYGSYKYLESEYPAIYHHLFSYKNKLENRGQCRYTSSGKQNTAADYIGQHHWLELDNNPSDNYLDDFSKQKIAWGNLCLEPKFTIVEENVFVSAPSPIIVPGTKTLLAILNSKIANWYIKNLGVTRNGGYFEYKPMFVEKLPIPEISNETKTILENLINNIDTAIKNNEEYNAFQTEIDNIICQCYRLNEKEVEYINTL